MKICVLGKFTRWALVCAVSGASVSVLAQEREVDKFDPAAIKSGGFYIVPVLATQVMRDDNIYSESSNEKSATITVIKPGVKVRGYAGITEVKVDYTHESGSYSTGSADNFSDNFLSLGLIVEPNHKNQASAEFALNQRHDERDANSTASQPDEYDEQLVNLGYRLGHAESLGRVELSYGSETKDYTNNRASTAGSDLSKDAYGATFFWGVANKTDILFEATTSNVDYDLSTSNKDADVNTYNVGVTWEASAKTTGLFKVGHTKRDFDNSAVADVELDSWELEALFAPRTYSTFSLTSTRSIKEASTSSGADAVDTKNYGLNWQHDWNGRFRSTAYSSVSEENFIGSARSDDVERVGLRLDYSMRRWLELGFEANYTDSQSTSANSNYDRSQLTLHLLMGI